MNRTIGNDFIGFWIGVALERVLDIWWEGYSIRSMFQWQKFYEKYLQKSG